MSALILIN